jgi:hypothetical protein
MLDPHTAAELDVEQIRALVDDLILAHEDWLPPFDDSAQPAGTAGVGGTSVSTTAAPRA